MLLVAGSVLFAQNYPHEWQKYTTDSYYHDIESATDKQAALNLANTNLARQVQMRVSEVSLMDKKVVNGKTKTLYASQKSFSTNVDMNLAETKSFYNEELNKYYVIVFIDKVAACTFYENEVKMTISNAVNAISIADDYVAKGFKSRAKNELVSAQHLFDDVAKPFFWLNVFGLEENQILGYLERLHGHEQTIKQMIADLEHGTTYYVECDADLFGKRYVKLQNELKGELSASGCNFVDDPTAADIIIRVSASAREYNTIDNGGAAFFAYVDAAISVEKTATRQRIFEDEISVKGAHTLSYVEAGRDGYKQLSKEINKILKDNIKL